MQDVAQTCCKLKTRICEHYRKIIKMENNDTFLSQRLKRSGHSLNNVTVQPVEKLFML